MSSTGTGTAKKQNKAVFLNIPKEWMYLIGYEYQAINQHGALKMTRGKKPVMKRIDHADLFLLDEIRGFGERGSKECFEEAVALARAAGMVGEEKRVCDKVLQLIGLGFVSANRQIDANKMMPKLVLSVDTQLVNDVAEARKESFLEEQRIHSQQTKVRTLLRENNMLQEYLQEYLQKNIQEQLPEDLPEYRQEHIQKQVQEDSQKPVPEELSKQLQEELQEQLQEELPPNSVLPPQAVKHLPPVAEPIVSDTISKDFDILDGETNDAISSKCLWRVDDLKKAVGRVWWPEVLDWVKDYYGKEYPRIGRSIDSILWEMGKCSATDTEIDEMIAVANYLLDGIRSDPDLEQHVPSVAHFKPLMRETTAAERSTATEKGERY